MHSVRDLMIEGHSYESAVDVLAGAADDYRTRLKEAGWGNPLVAPYFCEHCHWSENAHPRDDCPGFQPGDPDEVRRQNVAKGLPA